MTRKDAFAENFAELETIGQGQYEVVRSRGVEIKNGLRFDTEWTYAAGATAESVERAQANAVRPFAIPPRQSR